MTVLLLVRHGETEWTTQRRLQGRTDVDLSKLGRRSAEGLRDQIDAWHPSSVVSSPLTRARSTAALLTDLDVTADDRWAEAGLGEWEGRTPAELGPDYASWRDGRLIPPGGEPTDLVRERACAAARAAADSVGPVLVVTHGGIIRALLAAYFDLSADRIEPVAAPSLTVIDVEPDAATVARLLRFNVQAA